MGKGRAVPYLCNEHNLAVLQNQVEEKKEGAVLLEKSHSRSEERRVGKECLE